MERWAHGQSFVGHHRTSYGECRTKMQGLVVIAQTSVRNGADTRLRRFYHDIQGKSKKSFLLQFEVDMGTVRKPTNESDKATLARVEKEMAKPRIAKSARKDA